MTQRTYQVAVFPGDRPGQFIAYLRDYSTEWAGCCLHHVEAEDGRSAKRLAIAEHRKSCPHAEASSVGSKP